MSNSPNIDITDLPTDIIGLVIQLSTIQTLQKIAEIGIVAREPGSIDTKQMVTTEAKRRLNETGFISNNNSYRATMHQLATHDDRDKRSWRPVAAGKDGFALIVSNGDIWQIMNQTRKKIEMNTKTRNVYHNHNEDDETDNNVAIAENGDVYTWERSTTPRKMSELNHIVTAALGSMHCLAIDIFGQVFSWGNNQEGQCGGNPTSTHITRAKKIDMFDGQIVQTAAAGYRHSIVVIQGEVFTFGSNNAGQLGIGYEGDPNDEDKTPHLVYLNENIYITEVAAGAAHCIALDNNGRVFGWGNNEFAQISPFEFNECYPHEIYIGGKAVAVAANSDNSFAVTERGNLVQLGLLRKRTGAIYDDTVHERHFTAMLPICIEPLGYNVTMASVYDENIIIVTKQAFTGKAIILQKYKTRNEHDQRTSAIPYWEEYNGIQCERRSILNGDPPR